MEEEEAIVDGDEGMCEEPVVEEIEQAPSQADCEFTPPLSVLWLQLWNLAWASAWETSRCATRATTTSSTFSLPLLQLQLHRSKLLVKERSRRKRAWTPFSTFPCTPAVISCLCMETFIFRSRQ